MSSQREKLEQGVKMYRPALDEMPPVTVVRKRKPKPASLVSKAKAAIQGKQRDGAGLLEKEANKTVNSLRARRKAEKELLDSL